MTKSYDTIAIDIAKKTLDVRTTSSRFELPNCSKGYEELLKKTSQLSTPLVVCEATGGYERSLEQFLHAKDRPVAIVNPSRIRAFAQSEGMKAKSDPIDSLMILRYAREKDIAPKPKPNPKLQELAALMDRRSHLSEQLAREKNRIQNTLKYIETSIKRMIRLLEKEIDRIEERIRKLVKADQRISEQSRIMRSVVGVGEITSWSILAYLPEIGSIKRNEIVALCGIAPFDRDSGKLKGKRRIVGGRAKIRRVLFLAARTAANHNKVIKPYVDRLREKGKPYKCAIVAAMRKLLIHLHILMKNYQLSLD